MSRECIERWSGCSGFARISASVAGASTSQKMRIASSSRGRDTSLQELIVEDADAGRFHYDVGARSLGNHVPDRVRGCGVDFHVGPFGRVDIAVFLPIECVRLVERRAIAPAREFAEHPAVIGRSAVPVGRQQARAVERNFHADISVAAAARCGVTMAINSSTRCAQE